MATAEKKPTAIESVPDGHSVIKGKGVNTIVHNHVVAKIAGIAVREVDGVHALAPHGAGQTLTKVARQLQGTQMRDLGVAVEVGSLEAAVDLRIITDYGASIPKVADAIFESVSAQIHSSTGLKVTEVNVEVVDLYFPEDEEVPGPLTEPRVR